MDMTQRLDPELAAPLDAWLKATGGRDQAARHSGRAAHDGRVDRRPNGQGAAD